MMRIAYRGTTVATVTLPSAMAQKLLDGVGIFWISWANCHIRTSYKFTNFSAEVKLTVQTFAFTLTTRAQNHWSSMENGYNIYSRYLVLWLSIQSTVTNDSVGFVSATIGGIPFYSCYAPPSLPIVGFTNFLD